MVHTGNVNGIQRFYLITVKEYVNRVVVNNGQNLVNVVYECPLKVNKEKNQEGAKWFCLGSSFFFDIRIAQSVNTCEVPNWIILFLSSSKKGQVNCASSISTDNLHSLFFLENVINEIRL